MTVSDKFQQKARTFSKFWDLNIILNGDCLLSNGPILFYMKIHSFQTNLLTWPSQRYHDFIQLGRWKVPQLWSGLEMVHFDWMIVREWPIALTESSFAAKNMYCTPSRKWQRDHFESEYFHPPTKNSGDILVFTGCISFQVSVLSSKFASQPHWDLGILRCAVWPGAGAVSPTGRIALATASTTERYRRSRRSVRWWMVGRDVSSGQSTPITYFHTKGGYPPWGRSQRVYTWKWMVDG